MEKVPQLSNNPCAALTEQDQEVLKDAAATLLDARGIVLMLTDFVGRAVGSIGGSTTDYVQDKFGIDLKGKAEELTASALWRLQSGSTLGMDTESDKEQWQWFHKLVAVTSGASAGFFGAPGLLWDLPITTGIIMRSIADIARSHSGENLDSDDTKRACIKVFAFGGPGEEDDDSHAGYWAVRSGLNHVVIEQLIRIVASRFGVALSEKIVAQAVPVAGMFAGGGINYAFIDYYQQMARVHFSVRGAERRSGDPAAVRQCFGEQVRSLRQARQLKRAAV